MKTITNKLGRLSLLTIVLALSIFLGTSKSYAQCSNATPYASITLASTNVVQTISSCSYAGEYSTLNLAVAGRTMRVTMSSIAGAYITIRSGTVGGPVIAQGASPLTFLNTFTGTLYAHWNTNSSCGTLNSCHTTTVQCTLCSVAAPSNDLICNATLITGCSASPVSISGTTVGASYTSVASCGSTTSADVWYRWTGVTIGQQITLNLCTGTSYDSWISAYTSSTGTCSGILTCVANNDDYCGAQSQITFIANATTIFVRVAGYSSSTGAFTLMRSCGLPFNPCAAANISALSCNVTNSNVFAGSGAWSGTMGSPYSTPGKEKIFTFTPAFSGIHSLNMISSVGFGYLDLFFKPVASGCNNTGWTYVDDIYSSELGNIVTTGMNLTAGVPYYILLDPEGTASLTRTWSLVCPSPQQITSTNVFQATTADVGPGLQNQQILRIEILTSGSQNPKMITDMIFNLGDMTAGGESNIMNAKIFYTGSSAIFNTSTLFAELGGAPVFGDNQPNVVNPIFLGQGSNNFWLTYDLNTNANCNHIIDANIAYFDVEYGSDQPYDVNAWSGWSLVEFNGNPAGSRTLASSYGLLPQGPFTVCQNILASWYRTGGYLGTYDFYVDGNLVFSGINETEVSYMSTAGVHTFEVRNTGNTWSCDVISITLGTQICYPTGSANACDNDDITSVSICGVTTTTAPQYSFGVPCNPGFTDLSTSPQYSPAVYTLQQCSNCPITIGIGGPLGGSFGEGVKAWIDFNDNGSFNDPNELVFNPTVLTSGTVPNNIVSGSISIPSNAPLGQHRMRVRSVYGSLSFTSTGSALYGETEDYTITVVPFSGVATPVAGIASVNTATGCNNQPAIFCVNGAVGAIQWMYAANAGGPYTAIANAGNACQTLYASGSGVIYVVAGSTAGCPAATVYSNEVSFTLLPSVAFDTPCNTSCGSNLLICGTSAEFANYNTSVDAGEPVPPASGCNSQSGWCISSLSNSAWFTFVTPAGSDGSATIQIKGSGATPAFDSQVALYSSSSGCGNYSGFTLIAANDDDAAYLAHGGNLFSSFLNIAPCTLLPNTTYYIQVEGYGSSVGAFKVVIGCTSGIAPALSVSPIVVCNNAGVCSANIVLANPTVLSSQCNSAVSFTNNAPAVFANGNTTVLWTGTDVYGSSTSISQLVTVNDCEAPVISVQAAGMVVECNGSGNAAQLAAWLASKGGALASDNCGSFVWTNNFSALTPSCGSAGSANVTFTAIDPSGNSSSTSAIFKIQDTTAPTLSVPASLVLCYDPGMTANPGMATGTDVCGGPIITWSRSDGATTLSGYPVGVTIITWTATDVCGNSTQGSSSVKRNAQLLGGLTALPTLPIRTCGYGFAANIVVGYPGTPQSVTLNPIVSGGAGPYTYQWAGTNLSRLSSTTIKNPVYTPSANGMACYTDSYYLTTTDAFGQGCTVISNSISIAVQFGNAGDFGDFSCPIPTKLSLCHMPPGNPANKNTMCLGLSAIVSHSFLLGTVSNSNHGNDCIGGCYQAPCGTIARTNQATSELLNEDVNSGLILENFPDPFKEITTLRFVMDKDTHVKMEVYDLSGKLIQVTFDDHVSAKQEVKVEFSGADLKNGLYIYKLITPTSVLSGKMILIKD